MADDKKIQSNLEDRGEGVRGTLLTGIDNDKQWSKLNGMQIPQVDATGNAPAKSQRSSSRNCPQCANRLTFVEETDLGNWTVKCTGCGKRWFHSELEAPENDWLFRSIPQDLVMRWMDARERELKKKGKW